jgi:hypothetical protein
MLSTVKRVGWMLNRDSTATGRDRSCCRGYRVGASYPALCWHERQATDRAERARTTLPPADTQSGILQRPYLWVTIGTCALVFLAAFESLAVTTIMPVVSRELRRAGPVRPGLRGPAGHRRDRDGGQPATGPTAAGPSSRCSPPWRSFALGLLVAGTAGPCGLLVAGRLVQGLGGGALTVALYVVVARIYPGLLHPRIFAAFSAAWVVPSLVGPFAAGLVAQLFELALGVPGRGRAGHSSPGDDDPVRGVFRNGPGTVPLTGTVPRSRRNRPASAGPGALGAGPAWPRSAVPRSTVLAGSPPPGLRRCAGPLLAGAAVVIALLAVRPLVPRGTLTARRGLPSVILVRGLGCGRFLRRRGLPAVPARWSSYAFSPTFAGLTLTGGALAWAAASAVQSRLGGRPGPIGVPSGSAR